MGNKMELFFSFFSFFVVLIYKYQNIEQNEVMCTSEKM